jgi:signal transduction histidine kinase
VTAAKAGTSARRGGSAFTVQGWLILVLSVMGVLVLAGAVIAGVLLNRTDAVSSQLSDHIQPARVAAYQLQAALRDQETSLRGYVIAADRQFLDPYYAGQRTEQTAAQEIRQRVGGRTELLDDLTAIEKAAAVWRASYAEPLIDSVVPGKPNVVNNGVAERGKDEFDRLRELFDVQNQQMTSVRADALNELKTVQSWRDGVLVAILAVFLVTAGLLAILVRRAVTRPLAALAAACRRITDGHFAEVIPSRGPKDLRAMSVDVENMRQRIVDDLEVSDEARTALAEQTAALDDQAVELRRSNAELEQFAYVASHDLQEPLRKVASFCQLLEKRYADKLDERGVEYIEFAVDGAKRMQVLINDLLTFSRVGRLNTLVTAVDLDTTLSTAITNTASAIEESGAEIVRASPLPTVTGDPTLLTQLWQNLISNAVKFRREDRVPRVVVDCEAGVDGHDGEYLFSVSDNGIGIAKEFSEKVFVIFQRLHVRDAYSGTGIGLALCKKIVEYHGGVIWIDTSYTDGTRFQVTSPTVTPAVISQGALT